MSKRINIILPERTVAVFDRVTAKGGRSRFIDHAVLHYIETQGRQSLRARLRAGYLANAEENLAIATDWFPLEEEVWKTIDKPPAKPARKSTRRA